MQNGLKKLICASMISICTVNLVFAEEKTSDLTQDVIAFGESAYGEHKGFVATKSSTGSKMDIDITEIPQSVSVITNDMMTTRNVQSIQNVTAYTAAITQPYGENGDSRTNYGKIRGLSYLYKSSFLDGLKLLHAGQVIPDYDPYALERVEVLKGPASVLYGAAGPGGLLNLQSKKPTDTGKKEIGFSYGTHSQRSIFTDINHTVNEDLKVRFTGKYKKGDKELEGSTNMSYFINPALTYNIDDDTTLDVNASFAKTQTKGLGMTFSGSKSHLNYHNSIAGNAAGIKTYLNSLSPLFTPATDALWIANVQNSADAVNALNLPSDLLIGLQDKEIFEKDHKALGATFTKQLSNDLKLRNSFRVMKQDGTYDFTQPSASGLNTQLGTLNPDLTKIYLDFYQNDYSLKSFVMDNNLEHTLQTKDIHNTSLFGLDFQYSDYTRKGIKPTQYQFDLVTRKPIIGALETDVNNDTHDKIFQTGLYASNSLKIHDKYVISTSLRYDKLKNKTTNNLTNTSSTQDDDNISGRLGFSYLMDNGFAPYATYSSSFSTNIGTDATGKQFDPSVGTQYEVGLKYKPSNLNALFTIAAFYIEEEDLVVTDPNNRGEKIQQGDAEVKGIEFDIVAQPNENTNITFSIAKMTGKEKNMADSRYEGRALGDLPNLTASVWADYTFRNTQAGDVKLGAGIKYIGDSQALSADHFDLVNGTPQKLYDVDGYTIVDALVSTQYKDWNIALNVNNLFDQQRKLQNNPVQSSETAGRTFTLTAKYTF